MKCKVCGKENQYFICIECLDKEQKNKVKHQDLIK